MVRAAVMTRPNAPIEVREFPEPTIEPGGIVLKTLYSEVCGTDVHLHHGHLAGVPYPIIPGHVSVGEIAQIGGEVRDLHGEALRVGERVTFLDVHETCGHCWYCLVAKASTRCPSRKVYGITYSAADGLLGGWAERIYLKPGVKVIKLPSSLSPETYIGGGCGLPTAFHAVERADIRLNDCVLVQGCGPVGLSAVAFARLRGAGDIAVIGAPQPRLQLASAMGADRTFDLASTTLDERRSKLLDLTQGRGFDVVIEATGNPAALIEGTSLTRDGGTYVVVGQYTDAGPVTLNPHLDLNKKHINLLGCWGSDFSHFYSAIAVMARHQNHISWSRLAETRFPLERAGEALQAVADLRVLKAIIQPNA